MQLSDLFIRTGTGYPAGIDGYRVWRNFHCVGDDRAHQRCIYCSREYGVSARLDRGIKLRV